MEGQLLFRRWREADLARSEADGILRQRVVEASQAEANARNAAKLREAAEDAARRQATTTTSPDVDAGGHAAGAAQADGVAPVRKEP